MAKATDIQNALITQVETDSVLATEFAGKVAKGLGRNFDYNTLGRGIRVYLAGSDPRFANMTGVDEITSYFFMVTVLFADLDEASTEDRKAKYDEWVRDAIKADMSIGDTALDVEFGKTEYREDPKHEALHYVLVQITARAYEA